MPKGGALEDGVWVSRQITKETEDEENLCLYIFFIFCFCVICRLTHTPRKTSGRGWTLVNVGLTMAIAILDEKWVRGEK